jgi:hypothetical protein
MKNAGQPNFKKKHLGDSFYLPNQNNIELIHHNHKNRKNNSILIKPLIQLIKENLYNYFFEQIENYFNIKTNNKSYLYNNVYYKKKEINKLFAEIDC